MYAKDCVKEFQLECELRRLSARTIRSYHNNVMLFLNYIEKHDAIDQIEDIRPLHIKQYVQYLLGKKLTASYANGIIKCLRAYFKFAQQGNISASTPPKR